LLAKVRELVLPAIEAQGKIEAWIVDDTGFAKKGVHSVGVARQYCGRLGKTDNCQIAVTLSIANHAASLPIAYRLYLPEDWVDDEARRKKAHVPDDVKFQTKPQIALAQIKAALAAGVRPGVVLADPAYGTDSGFRAGVRAMGLTYAVGVQSTLNVWPPGEEPLPPKPWSGRGRKPTHVRRDADHKPVSVKALAMKLPEEAWRTVAWREGSNETMSSRFAAVRIRPATRDWEFAAPPALEWLLIEWPEDEAAPTKYWLSTLPEPTPLEVLVDTAKSRWRIERDYEELKSELGLAHFEGRGWRGFHPHATLCIAAYGFLIRERAAIPPSGPRQRQKSALSDGSGQPADPDPTREARRQFSRDHASQTRRRARKIPRSLSVLSRRKAQIRALSPLMTQ
jgi:SRSO17 transposase